MNELKFYNLLYDLFVDTNIGIYVNNKGIPSYYVNYYQLMEKIVNAIAQIERNSGFNGGCG